MHPLSALEIFLFRAGTRKVLGMDFLRHAEAPLSRIKKKESPTRE